MNTTAPFELDERSYLREKVVTTYESLWRGEEIGVHGWTELFFLKVNASWIQSHIAGMPADKLKPLARRLFAECRARLAAHCDPQVQCHALETLSGLFLGLGCRSFHDFGPDVLNLLCSIEEADAQIGEVVANVQRLLGHEASKRFAPALHRAALRLLLCLAATAENLDQNILLEFVLLADVAPLLRVPLGVGAAAAANASDRSAELQLDLREDAMRLAVLLANYQRHEVRNGFRRLLSAAADDQALLPPLLQCVQRVLQRAMYPAGGVGTSYLGTGLAHSLLRTMSWAAHALTLEDYMPATLSRHMSGPHTVAAHAPVLCSAMMLCWELVVVRGGAGFVALCDADGMVAGRAELLRNLLSVTSLLACDVREPLPAALLKLSFFLAEGLADGAATAPLLLAIDNGGGLLLWRLALGRLEECAVPSPQPLLSALYQILADFLSGNLRRSGMQVDLYSEALLLLQRLLQLQQASGLALPLLRWPAVWEGVLAAATFIATEEMFGVAGVPELGLRLLQVLNHLVAVGDAVFPSAAVFEAFAYELVRNHRVFERLYKLGKRSAPQLVGALKMTRSLIVQALEALPQVEAAGKLTAAEAMAAVRKLQLNVSAEARAEVTKPLPPHSQHEQSLFRQQLLRKLLTHARTDGSLAPVPFEELSKGAPTTA